VVSEHRKSYFLSIAEKRGTFYIHAAEKKRQMPMPDLAVEREMRELRARLDAMETTQRRTADVGDINEAESENETGNEGEEVAVEDAADECLFRVVARIGAREKMDIPSV
jgi:hypothetical protein